MSSLDIVTTEDEQFKAHYPKIMTKVKTKKQTEMEPTLEETTRVSEIIIDYIKAPYIDPVTKDIINKILKFYN